MLKYPLGFSVYVSNFDSQKSFLEALPNKNTLIFTSLHMPEEMGNDYTNQVTTMLQWLNKQGFKVIGDISKRTLAIFNEVSIASLAKKLNLHMVRIDYGFSLEEMIEAAKEFPLVFNASTVDIESALKIKEASGKVIAIHNFYPREHTGLSKRQFDEINHRLKENDIDVITFIPNHKSSRGPVFSGLPTLEHQRYQSPWVSFLELSSSSEIDGILLSDLELDPKDLQAILSYQESGIISLPTSFDKPFNHLIDQIYTIRIDSPDILLRLEESREFATPGKIIEPYNCTTREVGSITCDNKHYGRYSGEIQILKEALPTDYRVNVVGQLQKNYTLLTKFIPNGSKIKFTL